VKNFDSRVNLDTALVLSQTAPTIDAISACLDSLKGQLKYTNDLHTGRDQVLSKLKLVDMNESNRDACLPKTRLDVMKFIVRVDSRWIKRSKGSSVALWFGWVGEEYAFDNNGAWRMRGLRRLGAFFFFDRDIPERNAATLITDASISTGPIRCSHRC
jgi:hypothetical protein